MDILFITPTENLHLREEANGTMLLATKLLEAGFDTQILRFGQIGSYEKDYHRFIDEIIDKILSFAPRCVSLYTLWPCYHVMLRIVKELKARAPRIITVMGGPQSSATAPATMEACPQLDYICSGEGENLVVDFFNGVLTGDLQAVAEVPGVYYRHNGAVCHNRNEAPLCDLNTLPHWDDRLYLERYDQPEKMWDSERYFMPIDAGRGCPYNCTFCCTSHFWRRTYRLKSADRILRDIRYYHDKFGIRSFWFSHDAFTTDRKLVAQVCDQILESGLQIVWKCTARIDCITEELIKKMKQAGLTHIELGVETGSKRMQKLTNKNLDLQRVKAMVQFLLDCGLHVSLFFMYGFPEETEEDLNDTMELQMTMLDMGVDQVSTSFCRFNPQTAITEKYFDSLVLEPKMKLLTRAIFGYREELDMIREYKALFPFYYHLPTAVRENYHYLMYFMYLYEHFPMTGRYLHALCAGNNLRLYQAFSRGNRDLLEGPVSVMVSTIRDEPMTAAAKMLEALDLPQSQQVCSMMRFEQDLEKMKRAEPNALLRRVYDFYYPDLQKKKPLEQLKPVKTELLLRKLGNQVSINVLRFVEEA